MKFIGIKTSQDIEKYFKENEVNILLEFSSIDSRPIRIGYCLLDDKFVLRFIAIQLDNTPTYETFELFDMEYSNYFTSTDVKPIKVIAQSVSDEIIKYNNTILQYYKVKL